MQPDNPNGQTWQDHRNGLTDSNGDLPPGRTENQLKGDFGESQTAARMEDLGYEPISRPDRAQGIDHVFHHPETGRVLIMESKFSSSGSPGTGYAGGTRQMSDDWIDGSLPHSSRSRLSDALDGDALRAAGLNERAIRRGLDTGDTGRVLSQIGPDGNVRLRALDSDGRLVSDAPHL